MDIDKISRDNILKKIDDLKPLNKSVYDSAMNHMKNILNNFIKSNGFENICELRNGSDVTRFEIVIKRENGYTFDIDVNFEKDWHHVNEGKRMLTFNFCSFGSFYVNEMYKRRYLIVLGKLTEQMMDIECKMLDFDWSEYDEIRDKFHNANHELTMYDQEVKNREFENKKNEILESLIVGSKIFVGKKNVWIEESGFTDIDDIRTIDRIGNKTVDVSRMNHRMKKHDVVYKIAKGHWKIVK